MVRVLTSMAIVCNKTTPLPWVPEPCLFANTLQGTPKAKTEETGLTTAKLGNARERDGDKGGLSWLTDAAGNTGPAAATPTGASSAAEPESEGDWLSVAKSSVRTLSKSRVVGPAANAALSAAPGGWMSSGKLGVSTEDDSDQDDTGKVGRGSAKSKKKRQAREAASTASVSGGWLGSGGLGIPAEDESGDEDEESHGGGGHGVGVTIETQTEDDIEAAIEGGAIEKGDAPKLPPWAKPWVPPPKPEVVPDAVPEVMSPPFEETDKQVIKGMCKPGICYCAIPLTECIPSPQPSAPSRAHASTIDPPIL